MPADSADEISQPLANMARRLIIGSDKKRYAPFDRVNYQAELDQDKWQFPEALLSMYHHPSFKLLSDEQRWQLSLAEAANFFSFNIRGEQALIAALEPRLYRNRRAGEDPLSSRYLQRFIHEENSHTYMMSGYCIRYFGKVLPNQNLPVASPSFSAEGEDLLFWGRIFILETFLGFVNSCASSAENVDRTAREIHQYHFEDEVRHKAWDKEMMFENISRLTSAGRSEEIKAIQDLLSSYQHYIDSAMCSPASYRAAKISDALKVRDECLSLANRQNDLRAWKLPVERAFADMGMETVTPHPV